MEGDKVMKTTARRAAAVAAVLAAVSLLPGPVNDAAAAGPSAARPAAAQSSDTSGGEVDTYITGMPSSLRTGRTVTCTLYYRVHAHERFAPLNVELDIYGEAAYKHISATLYDPVTRKWEKPYAPPHSTDYEFGIGGSYPSLGVKPGALAHFTVRVTFAKGAKTGRWSVDGVPTGFLLTSSGALDIHHFLDGTMKVTRFTVHS